MQLLLWLISVNLHTPRYKAAYSESLNDILSYNFLVIAFQKVSNLGNNHEVSCAAIMEKDPSAPSGYYWLRSANGSAVRVFCDMTLTCKGVGGGWMQVIKPELAITAGHRTISEQISPLCNPNCIWSDNMAEHES